MSRLPGIALLIGVALNAGTDAPIGVWRGESLCAGSAPSCHQEQVVYYIEAIADKPDSVLIRADKIVNGSAITMGSGRWKYDAAKHTLAWETAQRVWLLHIEGKRIEGTLTMPDGVVFRRLTLAKDDTPATRPHPPAN
jgi:hypothetical protein